MSGRHPPPPRPRAPYHYRPHGTNEDRPSTLHERNRELRNFIEERTGLAWQSECLSEERDGILNYTHHHNYSGNDEAATHFLAGPLEAGLAEKIHALISQRWHDCIPRLDRRNGTLWLNIDRARKLYDNTDFREATAETPLRELAQHGAETTQGQAR